MVSKEPKQAKGGVYAQTDVSLIKDALIFYAANNGQITEKELRQIANLLHRLNSRI
jgi:hypothetical protein